tara:strand:- start:2041 stop:3714 length:1674 start_codon:yes stop_codon:yes gene_type:complete
MSERTREDYKSAVSKAVSLQKEAEQGGDVEAAKRHAEAAEYLATEAAELFGAYQAPLDPNREPLDYMGLKGYSEGVSDRYEKSDFAGPFGEFPSEVSRRREKLGRSPSSPVANAVATAGVGASQVLRTGGELLGEGVSLVLPDFVREGAEEVWGAVKNKPVVKQGLQALTEGLEVYNEWAKEHPSAAEAIETGVDISLFTASSTKLDVSNAAKKSKDRFDNAVTEERMAGIDKLLEPEYVGEPGFAINNFKSVGGVLDRTEYIPTPKERRIRQALESIKNLDVNSHFARAATIVSENIITSTKELTAFITKAGNPTYNRTQFIDSLKLDLDKLDTTQEYTLLSSAAQVKTKELAEMAFKILGDNDGDALGLLKARREFDEYVNFGGAKDPLNIDVESAKGVAGRYVRSLLNDKLKDITPGEGVHERLDRLHLILTARQRLNQRKIKEGSNVLTRTWGRISSVANLPTTPLALLATLGAVGTAGATIGAGTAAATFVAIQAAKKTTRLKFYATVLSGIDKTLKTYKSDKNLVATLKADRSYIVYLMNETRQEEETNGK